MTDTITTDLAKIAFWLDLPSPARNLKLFDEETQGPQRLASIVNQVQDWGETRIPGQWLPTCP